LPSGQRQQLLQWESKVYQEPGRGHLRQGDRR